MASAAARKKAEKKTVFIPIILPLLLINLKWLTKNTHWKKQTNKQKQTHLSVVQWVTSRKALSHIHMCTWGPSHSTDSNTGPQNPTIPTPLYSSFLCSFSFSFFLFDASQICIYSRVCKIHLSKWKYRKMERGRERTDGFKEKKKQSVGAEEEEGSARVLKRQAHLPLHLHTA